MNTGKPRRAPGEYRAKRAFDISMALVLLLFVGPSWIAVLVFLVLVERRLPFSMILAAGRRGVPLKLPFLYLRTPEGRKMLRNVTLANPSLHRAFIVFPQLLYVLAGKLSFVGPTPHHLRRSLFLENQFPAHTSRRDARPGLISPRTLAVDSRSERLALDIELLYLERASLSSDLWLVWRLLCDRSQHL